MGADFSGLINFFVPIFSFLFVFIISFMVLKSTKVLGESNWVLVFLGLIIATIFTSFSSINLYVTTIIPWLVVLVFAVFAILLLTGFAGKSFSGKPLSIVMLILLLIVFLVAAIKVFNPVFHPDLIITEGNSGQVGIVGQTVEFFTSSNVAGSVLLILAAIAVSWVLFKVK
jgi:hypothetical protein